MFTVNILDKTYNLDERTPVLNLADNADKKYMAVKVNNRLRELTYELCYDADVKLLDLTSLKRSQGIRNQSAISSCNGFSQYLSRLSNKKFVMQFRVL